MTWWRDWARSANMRASSVWGTMPPVSGVAAGVEDDGADAVAEGGSAGVAEGDDVVSGGLKCSGEEAELGGFAGAVQALEGDEVAAGHRCEFT